MSIMKYSLYYTRLQHSIQPFKNEWKTYRFKSITDRYKLFFLLLIYE